MYVDYSYYRDKFGGTMPENSFTMAERRAEAYIRYLTHVNGNIFAQEHDMVKDAVCAAAGIYDQYEQERKRQTAEGRPGELKSETIDGYSAAYVTEQADGQTAESVIRKKLYEVVYLYLLPTGWLSRKVRCACENQCGYHDL